MASCSFLINNFAVGNIGEAIAKSLRFADLKAGLACSTGSEASGFGSLGSHFESRRCPELSLFSGVCFGITEDWLSYYSISV